MSLDWLDDLTYIRMWLPKEELKELRRYIKQLRDNQRDLPAIETVPSVNEKS